MTVRVMTDSAADLPEHILKQYNIATVPTVIRFGDEIYYEGVDITLDQYYKKFFSSEVHPQTANPTLHHDFELYKKLGEEADEIINVVISSGISGSYNTSRNAKKMYERRVENPANVYIYDSKFATYGIGIIAVRAAELAQEGYSAEEIIPELDKIRDQLQVAFTVDNLIYLHKGGRLSKSKYWITKITDLKPIIVFNDGKMEVEKTVRSYDKALIEATNIAYEKAGKPKKFNVYIMHAKSEEAANKIKEYIQNTIQPEEFNVRIAELGMTIVTHVGPGCVGVCIDPVYKFID
ncbi:MAG: DegV family protein [Candidatus Heimdallarchaeaceae archaeon]